MVPRRQNGRVSEADEQLVTPFQAFGGHAFFECLVGGFYRRVAEDPVLRSLYPGENLAPAEERLRLFLEQYWGGPATYSEQRGHPRLRMRHAPFAIGPEQRDAWLTHMRDAVDSLELTAEQDAALWGYLEMAAHSMQNRWPDDAPGLLGP